MSVKSKSDVDPGATSFPLAGRAPASVQRAMRPLLTGHEIGGIGRAIAGMAGAFEQRNGIPLLVVAAGAATDLGGKSGEIVAAEVQGERRPGAAKTRYPQRTIRAPFNAGARRLISACAQVDERDIELPRNGFGNLLFADIGLFDKNPSKLATGAFLFFQGEF